MFEIGDKVIQIKRGWITSDDAKRNWRGARPDLGKVYVVSHCWQAFDGTWICFFCGFGSEPPVYNGRPHGYPCEYFRRIDEVKLIVEAAKHFKEFSPACSSTELQETGMDAKGGGN